MVLNTDRQMVSELLAPEIEQMLREKRIVDARAALNELLDPEIADVLNCLDAHWRGAAFRILPRDRRIDVFPLLEFDEQESLLQSLTTEQTAEIFNEMDPDDRVEFLEDADDQLVANLMGLMRPEERRETEKILEYPEESVGRLLTTDFLTLRAHWTVAQALDHIRKEGADAETLHTLYVTDAQGHLRDHILLRHLVLAEPHATCESLLEGYIVSLKVTEDREEAVHMMERYDLPVLPVTDDQGILVGIVTFDDVQDVMEEEATEDIQKIGGMEALNEPYFATDLLQLVRKRGVWLTMLFVGEILTISAISGFQDQIAQVVALAFFMPLVIASGGNSGSQAAALMIRAMAIGEVRASDWLRVVRREITSGLLMGLWLGTMGIIIVLAFAGLGWVPLPDLYIKVAITVFLTLLLVVTCGTFIGSSLPFLLRACHIDPATGSNPLVATLMDVTGLMIYFTLATIILKYFPF